MPPAEHECFDGTESANESADNMDIEEHEYRGNNDVDMDEIPHSFDKEGIVEEVEDFDAGQEAGDRFFDGSDEAVDSDSENNDYDDEDLLSLDEIQEAIQDELGPGMDLEMWRLRKS